jgi:adenylylsulfate kinase
MPDNVFKPNYSKVLIRDREKSNGHRACVLWFTGLSGSGKSNLAFSLEKILVQKGLNAYVLDGDQIRAGLNADLDFSPQGRSENIRRIAEVAAIMKDAGFVVLTAFISPFKTDRAKAREICGSENFDEIFVKCPLEVCEKRDVKGLYKKARIGEIPDFTGLSSPYEEPESPDLILDTNNQTIEQCLDSLMTFVLAEIKLDGK